MRRVTLLLATLVAILGLGAPAYAGAPSPSYELTECNPGQVCLFDTKIFGTDYYRYVINDHTSGFCFDIPADWDNRTNVIYNRSSHSVTAYTGNVCNGALAPYPILPGQRKGLGDNEEEANSILFHGGSGCLSDAPCLAPVAFRGPAVPTPDPGNAHNLVQAAVDCEDFHGLCLYDAANYQGDFYFLNMPQNVTSFCVDLTGTGFNNRANSVSVNGPSKFPWRSSVRLYNNATCGASTLLDPPERLYSPNLNSTMADNITSSVRITVEDWV